MAKAELEITIYLPLPGWPRAVIRTDYTYDGASLLVEGREVARAKRLVELEHGVAGKLASGEPVEMRLNTSDSGRHTFAVRVAGQLARLEDRLKAPPSRSAWVHATVALAASGAGFIASYLYLLRAQTEQGDWALKMGNHMAGWHLLLTFTLFPASVWGGRGAIRGVQFVSIVFFFIHLGIAIANIGSDDGGHTGAIAFFNALSGILFLVASFYGNRAHRDMDPVEALRQGRID